VAEEWRNKEDFMRLLDKAMALGSTYADVRYQVQDSENIEVENKVLKSYSSNKLSGIGVRVVVNGAVGYASSSDMSHESLQKTLENSVKAAKSIGKQERPFGVSEVNKADVSCPFKIDPLKVSPEEKVSIALDSNKAAWIGDEIKNVITLYGLVKDHRLFMSTEGADVNVENTLIGFASISVAQVSGVMEFTPDFKSNCQGFEFIKSRDWNRFAVEVSELALEGAKAKTAPAGTYTVVVDPKALGVVLHEAFGHATEGDLVFTGASVLKDRLGKRIADECVTVIDEGVVEGGFYHPYDDEGIRKTKTVVVENGVLKSYLLDRTSAMEAEAKSTGNGRAQDFRNMPIVRQTNFYVKPRDYTFEELVEDVDFGIYVGGRGLKGGQVESGNGTFTFGVGPSKIIKDGELTDTVRGVNISGSILDTLKTMDAVGKNLEVSTMVFGGCGKMAQRVFVGDGGPQVRIRKMTVGGQ
jgi:TldD protein